MQSCCLVAQEARLPEDLGLVFIKPAFIKRAHRNKIEQTSSPHSPFSPLLPTSAGELLFQFSPVILIFRTLLFLPSLFLLLLLLDLEGVHLLRLPIPVLEPRDHKGDEPKKVPAHPGARGE